MIYGDIVLEQKFNSLIKSPTEIMKEYYENEIYFLNSVIECQNFYYENGVITESNIEYLHEGFVSNALNKLKEILHNFLEWIKNIFKSIANIFKKDSKSSYETKKKETEVKNNIQKINKDTTKSPEQKQGEIIKEIKKVKPVVSTSKSPEKKENIKKSYFTYYDTSLIMSGYKKIFNYDDIIGDNISTRF